VVPLLATRWSHAPGETHLTVVPCSWRATPNMFCQRPVRLWADSKICPLVARGGCPLTTISSRRALAAGTPLPGLKVAQVTAASLRELHGRLSTRAVSTLAARRRHVYRGARSARTRRLRRHLDRLRLWITWTSPCFAWPMAMTVADTRQHPPLTGVVVSCAGASPNPGRRPPPPRATSSGATLRAGRLWAARASVPFEIATGMRQPPGVLVQW
jgi:hypothetical protein